MENSRISPHGLHWLNSTGGPLILLERSLLCYWRGTMTNSQSEPSDYDRACNVDDYLGLIDVGSGQALVLGDEPMQTCWWPLTLCQGILVRWHWAPSEDVVYKSLAGDLNNITWENADLEIRFSDGDLIVIDSSCLGDDLDDSLKFQLNPGQYRVDTALFRPNKDILSGVTSHSLGMRP